MGTLPQPTRVLLSSFRPHPASHVVRGFTGSPPARCAQWSGNLEAQEATDPLLPQPYPTCRIRRQPSSRPPPSIPPQEGCAGERPAPRFLRKYHFSQNGG